MKGSYRFRSNFLSLQAKRAFTWAFIVSSSLHRHGEATTLPNVPARPAYMSGRRRYQPTVGGRNHTLKVLHCNTGHDEEPPYDARWSEKSQFCRLSIADRRMKPAQRSAVPSIWGDANCEADAISTAHTSVS